MTPLAHVVLPVTVLQEMLAHARSAAPAECCGLLIGAAGWAGARGPGDDAHANLHIDSSTPARNLHHSRTRYLIDPADHFAAIRAARARGRAVVGGYHSHPSGPPTPSDTDHREASDAGFLYLIVSPRTGTVTAWRLSAGRLRAVTMRIQTDGSGSPTHPER